jgi:hypothetical protein
MLRAIAFALRVLMLRAIALALRARPLQSTRLRAVLFVVAATRPHEEGKTPTREYFIVFANCT